MLIVTARIGSFPQLEEGHIYIYGRRKCVVTAKLLRGMCSLTPMHAGSKFLCAIIIMAACLKSACMCESCMYVSMHVYVSIADDEGIGTAILVFSSDGSYSKY